MKHLKMLATAVVLAGAASTASAQPAQLQGSDTLFGLITDAISESGLDADLQYTGGGSGLGEAALVNGTQNIAPMSRALSVNAINSLNEQGATPIQSIIGLDGVSLYVRADQSVNEISIADIRAIYTANQGACLDWSQIPNSGKTGPIVAYRRNDASGTTDVFRTLVGITAFGNCVTVLASTEDIAERTSTEADAIGYSGLSAHRTGTEEEPLPANKPLAVQRAAGQPFVAPSTETIRDFSYPLARRLYVNWVTDGRFPTVAEQALLDNLLDRTFLDPLLVEHEFVTCGGTCR